MKNRSRGRKMEERKGKGMKKRRREKKKGDGKVRNTVGQNSQEYRLKY